MKNKKYRIIALILALVLSNLVAVPVSTQPATITDLEKEKEELEKEKQEADEKKKEEQAKLDAANKEADSISGDLGEINEEMEQVNDELAETIAAIDIVNESIAETKFKLAATTTEYEEAKANEDEQYASMKKRIRYMYEKGDYTYMQLLIESQGFGDMMNKVEYIEKLYAYDRKLLAEYEEACAVTLALKNELEQEEEELEESMQSLEDEKTYYNDLIAELKEDQDTYESRLSAAKAKADEYKANVTAQNKQIKELADKAAAKQDEIDAEKKRQEEEAAKAAEEAAKASESSDSSTSSSSSSSSYSSGTTVTSSGSSSSAPSSSSKSYNPASYYNSGDKGSDIISYATQFVGNPYVSGGTSLTNGADCSGFVMTVYKDFGYSLPRTSTSMRSVGREVSYEDARPGDIVCYAGHVALYMGNGKIVHASTPSGGIKIGNISYKPVLTIRRIV